MNKILKISLIILAVKLLAVSNGFAQGQVYQGPDDAAGDIAAEREGNMTGNRVFLYFRNTTELSDWPKAEVSRWPNNYEGVKMTDGIGLLIGARVFLENDSIPVTDPAEIKARNDLDTLYYLQTSYREEMDTNPQGTVEWGLYPVFGYFDEMSEHPAMSNDSLSWPPAGWPYYGRSTQWPGEWDGRFGRGQIRADLETYFVANDAHDQEYVGPEDRVKYFPRPGVKIGDIRPNVTIQYGLPWGGIGVRVEQRGFQWNNPQARDAIFWEYTIANISDYDLPQMAFGYWVDNAIGGEGDDELGYFDRKIDLAYSWDIDGRGRAALPTGTMGFAYLESPGLGYDNIDNDEDGLVDERRDNEATVMVGPTDNIQNLDLFLETYNLTENDLKPHWDADEDQDWMDGVDLNNNGTYSMNVGTDENPIWALEPGEDAGDDVGLDGVGPTELNYNGPDEGECNHRPDSEEFNAEPNFNNTDVTESDMVGLTSFMLFPIQPQRPPYTKWFRNDKSMWEVIGSDTLVEFLGSISNLVETFASGTFPLYQGKTERISMSELHSYDPLEGLMSDAHTAPSLYDKKRIVQLIYEKDYQFAQPPKMPTLTATPTDGSVILSWDNMADTKTRDPFLRNVNDFQGYKIFRASDKKFSDSEVITDGYGTPMFKKPVFQCDLIDDTKGFTDFGLVNGMGYDLGQDTGIIHHWVDNTVQNGRTYYYAIVAYDSGASKIGPGIAPSENNAVIELDEAEDILFYGKNVQIATPHQTAAGYIPPSIDTHMENKTLGTGTVELDILAKNGLKFDHTYKVQFGVDTLKAVKNYDHGLEYINNGIFVYDVTEGERLVYQETSTNYAFNNLVYDEENEFWNIKIGEKVVTDIFEGMVLKLSDHVLKARRDTENSAWLKGDALVFFMSTLEGIKYFPWDYNIVFTDQDSAYVGRVTNKSMLDEAGGRIPRAELLTELPFSFYVENESFTDSSGSYELLDLVGQDMDKDGMFNILKDRVLAGPVNSKGWWAGTAFTIDFRALTDSSALPKPNDVYRIKHLRPFTADDSILFKINPGKGLDVADLRVTMDKIKVIPNPYVATNAMEPSLANPLLNQRRQILFTHLPAQCTISIFTASGILVDNIDVDNVADNGTAHWDLLTKEGLEVAAGMYLYYVKAEETGDEQFGKFAIIK